MPGHAGRSDLEEVQDHRLRRLVHHVARCPYYRERFEAAGIDPHRFRGLQDLQALPMTDGEPLHDVERIRCCDESEVVASFASSGTTGAPKRVDLNEADVQLVSNLGALSLRLAHSERLVAVIALPLQHGLWVGWRQATWIITRAGGLALPTGATDAGAVVETLRRYNANVLAAAPSFLLRVIEAAGEEGLGGIERVILGAEPLKDRQHQRIRQALPGAHLIHTYATTELGVGLAASVPAGEPVVFNEVHVIPEIVDPETHEPADEGELLYTTLTRRAMPLLRYRSGDRARWVPTDGPVELMGLRLPVRRLEVLGRVDEMLIVAGSNLPAQVLAETARRAAGESPDGEAPVEIRLHHEGDDPGRDVLKVRLGIEGDAEAIRQALLRSNQRIGDHIDNGELRVEIETGADLGDQLKPLSVSDDRG